MTIKERRNYRKNGHGRRSYDRNFLEHCLSCDLREEVNKKLSIKIFGIFVAFIVAILGIGASIAGIGLNNFADTSKATYEAVSGIKERTARMEARQEIIVDRLKDIDEDDEHARNEDF